jgi:hypothetical protein
MEKITISYGMLKSTCPFEVWIADISDDATMLTIDADGCITNAEGDQVAWIQEALNSLAFERWFARAGQISVSDLRMNIDGEHYSYTHVYMGDDGEIFAINCHHRGGIECDDMIKIFAISNGKYISEEAQDQFLRDNFDLLESIHNFHLKSRTDDCDGLRFYGIQDRWAAFEKTLPDIWDDMESWYYGNINIVSRLLGSCESIDDFFNGENAHAFSRGAWLNREAWDEYLADQMGRWDNE